MSVPTRVIKRGMFGNPTLQWLKNNGTESNGLATWVKEWTRYGEWTAKLAAGTQTDDDYGAVEFAVNGMRLDALKSIRYVYRMGGTELVAPNVAIHVYDPGDIDNRADITLSHTHDDLGVTGGWHKFDLVPATTGLFYYGNNIPSTTGLTGDNGTSLYTLTQYQEDAVFKTYVISKITIEYGYYSTGHLTAAHIAKISVNEEDILLEPPDSYTVVGTEVKTYYKATVSDSTTKVTLVTPATGRKIRVLSVKCSSSSTTGALFETYFHTGANITSTVTNAIDASYLDADLNTGESFAGWPDGASPVGAADEVVSMRTSANVSAAGSFTIVYREE